jgi:hypothetical protein
MQKAMAVYEEQFNQVIGHLQFDRMKLRGHNITQKLNKMQRDKGAFNTFVKK